MIHNVPTWQDLETISLRLYFNAWTSAANLVTEYLSVSDDKEDRWQQYTAAAQGELQAIYTLILQSQEIGIKGRIAEVSPFLLLKKHSASARLGPGRWDYDFSDFPTIDAAELIAVHNTFCRHQISDGFATAFEKLRRGRNKISHLGVFNERLDPLALVELLFAQFTELYPRHRWLPARLRYASDDKWAGFDFQTDWSPEAEVLKEIYDIQNSLTPAQHKVVFGHGPEEPRFICPPCGSALERYTSGNEPYPNEVPTAFQTDDAAVSCALCEATHSVHASICADSECDGRIVPAAPDWTRICLTCGNTPAEVDRMREWSRLS